MENKIIIGIPTTGSIKSKTALSLLETIRQNKDLDIIPVFQHGGFVAENRAKIVGVAQMMLASHLFFVDHDVVFSADTLPRLLAHDKGIVGCMYNYRKLPLQTTTKFFNEKGETVNEIDKIPDELFEVAAFGMGCSLIKMSVFTSLEKPYFPMEQNEEGDRVLSEDVGFYEKARDKGYKVYCDPTIKIGHIGDYIY